jgi:hypothetical protein
VIIKIDYLGKLVPFIELAVAHASILTILAISFERYVPDFYHHHFFLSTH